MTTLFTRMKMKSSLMLMWRTGIIMQRVSVPRRGLTPALKEEDPKEAINEFRVVVETEAASGEKGDWYHL
jgi:hypothetical protein